MSDQEIMAEIAESLKPKRVKASFDTLKSKVAQAKTADPSLFNLPLFCNEILSFISDREHEEDLAGRLDGFAVDMKAITETVVGNLVEIKRVKDSLDKRIQSFDFMEAKYQRLIDRVGDVLDELETVLKRS